MITERFAESRNGNQSQTLIMPVVVKDASLAVEFPMIFQEIFQEIHTQTLKKRWIVPPQVAREENNYGAIEEKSLS